MEQKPEFKRNLWGYEKEAVLKYIDEMSRSAKQTEEQLGQKLEQITRSREELEGQIADFEQIQIGFAAAGATKSVVVVPGC